MIQILEKGKNQSLKQYVYQTLSQNIVRLNLKPGEKLIESEISELLGISRTPIREALLDLAEKKLVNIIPRSGTFVSYMTWILWRSSYICGLLLSVIFQNLPVTF